MQSNKVMVSKEALQGVLVVDNFNDNFAPFTDDEPFVLLPLANIPIIEYSLDCLNLGGVQELFLFCCSHVEQIRRYIDKRIKESAVWSHTMKINIIASESCYSFGDCMRDLDVKGLIRGTFILAEAGIIGKHKFGDIVKKHNAILTKKDKGIAMTLINVKAGGKRKDECPYERQILLINKQGRVLLHKRRTNELQNKHVFPREIFLKNKSVDIRTDLMDTRVMVCSNSVLALFSDNFDFQTKDDFVRGILMNDEILDCTIYNHTINVGYASAVTSWRRYQKISREILLKYLYPIGPSLNVNGYGFEVLIGKNTELPKSTKISKSIIGDNVKIGNNVVLKNCFIFNNSAIADNCHIEYSVIGNNTKIDANSKLSNSCIIGNNVHLTAKTSLENVVIKGNQPELFQPKDKIGDKAFILNLDEEEVEGKRFVKYTKLFCNNDVIPEINWDTEDSDSEDEHVPADDTKMFFTEVVESLSRGFEDKLKCENLILEINSSRYAYNVTLREVNYFVSKAILSLPFQSSATQPYWQSLHSLLVFFSPILTNYIRNNDAMVDCLQAIEDVATAKDELFEAAVKALNWLYDEDFLTEEIIMQWFKKLDKSNRLYAKVSAFIKWLLEAEEESSSDE